jgi:DnaJ-class molecular chaperone
MGNNLIYKLNLHFQKAIDGYIYEHQHIDGKKYSVKIPPKTNDGDLLKMKDRGLMISDSQRGDLIFDINIVIDYNELEKNE